MSRDRAAIDRLELIAIGRIVKPIGTRGEVKVIPLTDDQQRFANVKSVWVGVNAYSANRRDILKVRIEAGHVIINLSDIETLKAAEELRNSYLFIPKDKSIEPNTGRYYVDDILGCEVLNEEHKVVGTIKDVFSLAMNDIWVVWNGKKEMLIPAVKAIVKRVDIGMKQIIIHDIEGLLE